VVGKIIACHWFITEPVASINKDYNQRNAGGLLFDQRENGELNS